MVDVLSFSTYNRYQSMMQNPKKSALLLSFLLTGLVFLVELTLILPDIALSKSIASTTSQFDTLMYALAFIPTLYFFAFLPVLRQLSKQNAMEEQLVVAAVAFQTHDGILIADQNAHIIRINQALENLTGYKEHEVKGKHIHLFQSSRHQANFYNTIKQALQHEGAWSGELWSLNKDGTEHPMYVTITAVQNHPDSPVQYVAVFTSMLEKKKTEEKMHHLAFYDALTGLPNKQLLLDRLDIAFSSSGRKHTHGALLYIDLDHFRVINDRYGNTQGDRLLSEIAMRLKFSLRESDTVARIGGDEFVIMLEQLGNDEADSAQNAAHIAENLSAILKTPLAIENHVVTITSSIGISLYFDHNLPINEVIRRAESAMFQAKNSGKNKVQFYDAQIQASMDIQHALETDLHKALKSDQLTLYYQPQYNDQRELIGAEALLRWIHPDRGMIPPADFIQMAEKSTLIIDIGQWVIKKACQQLQLWQQNPKTRHLVLAINISPKQFAQSDFVEQIAANLHHYKIDPSGIKLELTEGMLVDDIELIVRKMMILKHVIGVTLSLDDFGTGYSSLTYLKQLPIDQIKIDQSFVKHMTKDISDAKMVQNIIDLARNFGFEVIAEGVETEAQLAALIKCGCKLYQGYFFSKPVSIDIFDAQLSSNEYV